MEDDRRNEMEGGGEKTKKGEPENTERQMDTYIIQRRNA